MYSKKFIEMFQAPKFLGELKGANGVATVGEDFEGDIIRLYIAVDQNEMIQDASCKTVGCPTAIVASSLTAQLLIGKSIDQAEKITANQIQSLMGNFPHDKVCCVELAIEAIEQAIANYRKRIEKENNSK